MVAGEPAAGVEAGDREDPLPTGATSRQAPAVAGTRAVAVRRGCDSPADDVAAAAARRRRREPPESDGVITGIDAP